MVVDACSGAAPGRPLCDLTNGQKAALRSGAQQKAATTRPPAAGPLAAGPVPPGRRRHGLGGAPPTRWKNRNGNGNEAENSTEGGPLPQGCQGVAVKSERAAVRGGSGNKASARGSGRPAGAAVGVGEEWIPTPSQEPVWRPVAAAAAESHAPCPKETPKLQAAVLFGVPAAVAPRPNPLQGPGAGRRAARRSEQPKGLAMSSVARLFEGRNGFSSGCPEEDIDSVLAELVDSFLRSSHISSQKSLPCPRILAAKLQGIEREAVLHWLVQACDIMSFHESVLYSTVLLLDRYCATEGVHLSMDRIQKVLMAVLCTVMKVIAVQDELIYDDGSRDEFQYSGPLPLRDVFTHLCYAQVPFEEILRVEYEVLRALQFNVSAPSVLEFLDVLSAPLTSPSDPPDSCTPCSLASFMLQLSLFNVSIHYQHPHVILAASALYVALVSLRASPDLIEALMTGVTAACPEVSDVTSRIGSCACQLHGLWLDFAASGGAAVPSLMKKYGNGRRLSKELLLRPPALGTLPELAAKLAREEPVQELKVSMRSHPSTDVTRLR
ncbi:unnamed protein product [Polarella glacialis]|uniref:Cyclin N-terminal domain-containing protein n=1 Tax=Polarella glacialis TaxID=89957 RepID=A0A813HXT5_POLGL|nr:unnamed protein product [Polarella glacialis]